MTRGEAMNKRASMRRRWRLLLGAAAALMAVSIGTGPAMAAKATVDCAKGQRIQPRIKAGNIITVKGACTENIAIEVDNVVLTTDGVTPASIAPADPLVDTVAIDGAKGVVLDGVMRNGPGGVGVRCFSTATLTGNLANVSGTNGQSAGCNTFPTGS
jgi:hypothetical protein